MVLWLALVGAQLAPVAVSAPVSPPPIIVAPAPPVYRADSMRKVDPIVVDVTVSAGGAILYQGTLRTAASGMARFSQDKLEVAATPCDGTIAYLNSERSSFSVQLTPMDSIENRGNVTVAVDWTRSVGTGACGPGTARTVRVSQTVKLEPERPITLAGDAGLLVRLTRRQR